MSTERLGHQDLSTGRLLEDSVRWTKRRFLFVGIHSESQYVMQNRNIYTKLMIDRGQFNTKCRHAKENSIRVLLSTLSIAVDAMERKHPELTNAEMIISD